MTDHQQIIADLQRKLDAEGFKLDMEHRKLRAVMVEKYGEERIRAYELKVEREAEECTK